MVTAIGGSIYNNYYSQTNKLNVNSDNNDSQDTSINKVIGNTDDKECQTCKNRKYKDGSDENVSFKSAAHISPSAAGSMVRAHEGEHVTNAFEKAAKDNGEVINASVQIFTSVCPECGKTYVSGGQTNTSIKYTNESNPYMQDFKGKQGVSLKGKNFSSNI